MSDYYSSPVFAVICPNCGSRVHIWLEKTQCDGCDCKFRLLLDVERGDGWIMRMKLESEKGGA